MISYCYIFKTIQFEKERNNWLNLIATLNRTETVRYVLNNLIFFSLYWHLVKSLDSWCLDHKFLLLLSGGNEQHILFTIKIFLFLCKKPKTVSLTLQVKAAKHCLHSPHRTSQMSCYFWALFTDTVQSKSRLLQACIVKCFLYCLTESCFEAILIRSYDTTILSTIESVTNIYGLFQLFLQCDNIFHLWKSHSRTKKCISWFPCFV